MTFPVVRSWRWRRWDWMGPQGLPAAASTISIPQSCQGLASPTTTKPGSPAEARQPARCLGGPPSQWGCLSRWVGGQHVGLVHSPKSLGANDPAPRLRKFGDPCIKTTKMPQKIPGLSDWVILESLSHTVLGLPEAFHLGEMSKGHPSWAGVQLQPPSPKVHRRCCP